MPVITNPIRVVIVDDSPTVQSLLKSILGDAGMTVLATGKNGREAVQLVKKHRPDVITMDIRMPHMDGLEATRQIMREQPTPIVVITGSSQMQDVDLTFQAMQAGALAVIKKPGISDPQTCANVAQTVQNMAGVHVIHHWGSVKKKAVPKPTPQIKTMQRLDPASCAQVKIIGIASSTGGPSALAAVLGELPANYPLPILVVQHVSPGFTRGLVSWLNSVLKLRVEIAIRGNRPTPGTVTLAPDDYHLKVNKNGEIELSQAEPYKGLRPSGNPLFTSLAQHYGKTALGIVLTGMGDDGADGITLLHQTGAPTIAQDEQSCVVYGMPHQAVLRNAIDTQMNPQEIGLFLQQLGDVIK